MELGIKNTIKSIVASNNTANSVGSGTLDVFATPAMIALIEETAWKSVSPYLEENETTVGTSLDIKHLSPTPLGQEVKCETVLVSIEGRKLKFEANVYDNIGLIGQGTHERYIVDSNKFQNKANSKNDALKQ